VSDSVNSSHQSKPFEPSFDLRWDDVQPGLREKWHHWAEQNCENYLGAARQRLAEKQHVPVSQIEHKPNEEHAFLHLAIGGFYSQKFAPASRLGESLGVAKELQELAGPAWQHKWNDPFKEETNADLANNKFGNEIACGMAKTSHAWKLTDKYKKEFLNKIADEVVADKYCADFARMYKQKKAPDMWLIESAGNSLENIHTAIENQKGAYKSFVQDLRRAAVVRQISKPDSYQFR
jgi:hypothetical protein